MALLYRMGTGNGSGGDLKPYIVQFTCDSGYIGQTLTMTYKGTPHAGETVDNVSGTVVSDGTKGALTLYPMHSGNWECSCYSSVTGTTMKKTIELSYWGTTNVSFEDTPNGATVTPTDDVQTWLNCANIWDKTDLTTIDDVIADTTTLNILISDNNASDYLARSATWVSDVCSNESAMTYIGLNDYCANKLLADNTWTTAICNSTYFEKVLNVRVPTMRSDTTPSGTVIYSSQMVEPTRYGYQAFDGNDSTRWSPEQNTDGEAYIGYDFKKNIVCKKAKIYMSSDGQSNLNRKIQGFDGTKWVDLYSYTDTSSTSVHTDNFVIDGIKSCSQIRLWSEKATMSSNSGINVFEVQFYGREEV